MLPCVTFVVLVSIFVLDERSNAYSGYSHATVGAFAANGVS